MEKEIIEEKSKLNQEERKKEPKIINILFWIACFYFLIETIFCIIRIKYGNIPQLITYSLATISICPLFSKLLNLKKKINYNWIIQILVTIIIIFIGQFFFNFDSWHFNLTKKIDTENFSYYVSEEWRTKEEVKDNTKTEYYYPYNSNGEGFIMVSTEKNDNYSLKQKIDYDFVNNFIQGMGLKSNDIIRVKMDKINNNDCEIIDSYYNINNNRYEILIYIWINNNFCNTFSICQTEKIHSDFKKELEEILQNVSTKNISFDDSSLKMKINETKNIHVNYSPSDFKEDIIWTSSNEKIANVENGTISAISAGKATITATTSSGITRKIDVTVYTPTESITLDKTNLRMHVKDESVINLTVTPSDATYKEVAWSSKDTSIATVENGKVIAKAVGTTVITAKTSDGKSAECNVDVTEITEEEYKAMCSTYTYKQLARNPEDFKGKYVKLTGEVVQVIPGSISTAFRVDITKNGKYSTYYTDTIYATYYPEVGESKILENDIITIWGTAQGEISYKSVLGVEINLPNVFANYIEIN